MEMRPGLHLRAPLFVVQSFSRVRFFVTPWAAACQASLSGIRAYTFFYMHTSICLYADLQIRYLISYYKSLPCNVPSRFYNERRENSVNTGLSQERNNHPNFIDLFFNSKRLRCFGEGASYGGSRACLLSAVTLQERHIRHQKCPVHRG